MAAVAAIVVTAAAGQAPGAGAPQLLRARVQALLAAHHSAAPVGIEKIRHVVIIMQENRSFDDYFGTYPGAAGIPGLAGNPGAVPCVPDPREHCVKPFHDRHDFNYGAPHTRPAVEEDVNGGKMNGFIAQQEALGAPTKPADDAVGYHNGKDIPNYWTYARDFVLQDHMFEPVLGNSLPAHLYLVSAWSAICKVPHQPMSCKADIPATLNTKHPPDYAWADLTWLLDKAHVSWRYYIFKGIEPDCESDAKLTCAPRTQGPTSLGLWNPLRYFDTVRRDHQLGDIQSLNGFFTAAREGRLPAVSWIVPSYQVSEHPGSVLSHGQTYVTGLINLIMQSPDWQSTAIFLAWDDFGGLYDNVVPPVVDHVGYGLRVPGLLISPYARAGYIDQQTLSFDAYIKFIEDDFLGGARLDPSTDGWPDPRPDVRENAPQLGNLINEFDFNQAPRGPVLLPVHPKTDLVGP